MLDEWQENVLEAAMGERADGRWAVRTVGLSTPRQNGKSQLIVARALAGILLFGEQLIMCSAHQQDTAREVFSRMVDILEGNPSLNDRVESYGKALNREYIKFKSGQVIRFKARSAGGGRGFSADCLLLDEAQILSAAEWSAILPTMSARPNPQVWLLGTPPTPTDDGEVFGRIRAAGLAGKDTRLAYLEWSAEADDDLDDPQTWAKANPAYGTRIGPEAIESERASMSDEQFRMERLGIWAGSVTDPPVITREQWTALGVPEAPTEGIDSYGVKFSPDGAMVALCAARKTEGGVIHLELIERRSMGGGTGWLVEWLAGGEAPRWRKAAQIVVDGKAHAGNLVNALRSAGVPARVVVTPTTDQVTAAHSMLVDAVKAKTITVLAHPGQATLVDSVAASARREIGKTGGWGFRPIGDGECTSAESAVMAHWGAKTSKRRPGRKQKAVVMR